MHLLWMITILPMLTVPGIGDPVDVDTSETPLVDGSEVVDAQAEAHARAGGIDVNLSTDDLHVFVSTSLPGPGFSKPLDAVQAGLEAPGIGDGEKETSSAIPFPMPEPREAAIPAGLAVLGAAALAAARWRYLGPWLLAPLYSRIKRDDLLENEVRAKLHELITEEPGLSLQELCEGCGAGWGNTVYHLQRLEQAGFVKSKKQGHHRRFYKVGEVDQRDVEALGMLRNETPQKIAQFVVERPGCIQKDVCEALDISPSLAHKYLKRLEEQQLVSAEREWRSKHYTPDERLSQLVQQAAA